MTTEQEEFLKDLGNDQGDPFAAKDQEPEKEAIPEDDGEERQNRKNRRKMAQLEEKVADAEALISQLSDRLKTRTEAEKFKDETGDDYIKQVRAIYGDADPKALAASDILEKTLRQIREDAVKQAEERFDSRRGAESQAVTDEEKSIESELEKAEDETGLDLSEGSDDRQAVLRLVERRSRKDGDGNIIEFSDFVSAAEDFAEMKRGSGSGRAKELASRSMARSGQSQPSRAITSDIEKALRDNDII